MENHILLRRLERKKVPTISCMTEFVKIIQIKPFIQQHGSISHFFMHLLAYQLQLSMEIIMAGNNTDSFIVQVYKLRDGKMVLQIPLRLQWKRKYLNPNQTI